MTAQAQLPLSSTAQGLAVLRTLLSFPSYHSQVGVVWSVVTEERRHRPNESEPVSGASPSLFKYPGLAMVLEIACLF